MNIDEKIFELEKELSDLRMQWSKTHDEELKKDLETSAGILKSRITALQKAKGGYAKS